MDLRPTNLRRLAHGEGGLPLTSLIDVVFLLLIYFLITSRMTPQENRLASALSAPATSAARSRSPFQPQVVTLRSAGSGFVYVVGDREVATRPALQALLQRLPKDDGLFIKTPADVPVHAVTSAMQCAQDAGFTKVSYVPLTR
jgi:biopolymer transport protein ExbD